MYFRSHLALPSPPRPESQTSKLRISRRRHTPTQHNSAGCLRLRTHGRCIWCSGPPLSSPMCPLHRPVEPALLRALLSGDRNMGQGQICGI